MTMMTMSTMIENDSKWIDNDNDEDYDDVNESKMTTNYFDDDNDDGK